LVKNLESENERHFLALVSNIPGAIYRFRHENGWTIKFLSDKIFEVTGYPASDFVNHASHDLSRVIHPKDHYRLRRAVASAVSDKVPYIVDYRIIHSDGSVRWVHERGQGVFTNEGQLRFLEGALFDITRRKQSEHQLVEARQEAERANRAKSDFLANISHELRTPLNGILGYTQILQNSQNIPADHKHYADIIRQSGEYLLALIEDLLDFSKIEAAILELHTTIFNFPAFLEHIADIFTIRAKEKGIIFELAALSELPKWVSGDEKRLRQVLINLLSNAVKFTERGKVWLKVRHTDDAMDFEIGDTGFGIRAEDLTKIFEPFQQLRHGSIPPTGTGLGLSICEKLVNMMNGRLDITSTIGKGSAFTVRVDLPSASLPGKIKNSPPGDVTVRSNPPGILVVDDNPDNLTMVTELLSSAGYAVRTAAGWRQCLDEVNRLKPDVILMDMVTPGMDGLETTRRLRNSRSLDDVVIIAVSANALEQNQQEGLAAGCNGFVSKPLHLEELLDCLSKHVPGVFQASRAERWRSVVQSKAKAELTKGQVLVAEDNPINLMLINAQLSKIGVTVTKAKDGKQTLALIRQRAFDLIFLDLRMPILDGKQVMEGIKADPGANQHTPIIAITAFATNEERTATAQMGFSDFLIKPILEEKLIGVLTRWFYVPCTENPGSKRNLLRDNSNGSLSFIELMLNKTHRNHRV
ncbi:MAG: response regulator, partial [Pseudomonadota bacterium]